MPKIARPYDYQDPRDPSDIFDRFEQPDYEQRDKGGRSAERGQPFTWGEIEYFEFRQGITMCPTPVQQEPNPPGLTKMQAAWALTFDPLAGLDDAMATCREHIDLAKPTKPKNAAKLIRVQSVIKGILEGGTFADVATEMGQAISVISRDMADAYQKWPELIRPLLLVNSLNNMAKRREVSTAWQFSLQRGEQIFDDGVLIWGEWPNSGPRNHVADPDHIVKLAELQYKAFPPIRSNFGAAVAAIGHITKGEGEVTWEGAPNRGSQRTERTHYDRGGYELVRAGGSARIGAFKDYALSSFRRLRKWRRLREHAGLPDKYFHEETGGKACIWPLPDVGGLQDERAAWAFLRDEAKQFVDERWLAANYPATDDAVFDGKSFAGLRTAWEQKLGGPSAPFLWLAGVVLPIRYKAPYVPFVNEHKDDKLKKTIRVKNSARRGVLIHCGEDVVGPFRPGEDVVGHWWAPQPRTFKWPKDQLRPTRKCTRRWATEVHNATAYGTNANKQFLEIPGVKEPKPGWMSADVSVHRMVLDGEKWKRGRHGTRCAPVNSSLSSLPPLRADELITGWPVLAPSTRQDNAVLFEPQVTPSIGDTP